MDAVVVNDRQGGMIVLEGVVLSLFGLAAIAWPGMTVYIFTVLFGLFALIQGVVSVLRGIFNIGRGWTAIGSIVLGILLVAAGSYVFNHPGVSALTLVLLVGFTFIVRGIFEIVAGLSSDSGRALSIISGVLALLVGLVLLRYPVGGGTAYVWVLGIYALVSGPMLIAVGMGAGKPHVVEERA
jgi:uncharacterized membrane protein HdeD (DUF308 family)